MLFERGQSVWCHWSGCYNLEGKWLDGRIPEMSGYSGFSGTVVGHDQRPDNSGWHFRRVDDWYKLRISGRSGYYHREIVEEELEAWKPTSGTAE